MTEYELAQLRHAYHHLAEGRVLAAKEVIAFSIRTEERRREDIVKRRVPYTVATIELEDLMGRATRTVLGKLV